HLEVAFDLEGPHPELDFGLCHLDVAGGLRTLHRRGEQFLEPRLPAAHGEGIGPLVDLKHPLDRGASADPWDVATLSHRGVEPTVRVRAEFERRLPGGARHVILLTTHGNLLLRVLTGFKRSCSASFRVLSWCMSSPPFQSGPAARPVSRC